MTRTLLSLGHGFSARAIARDLMATSDWSITGTTRSADKARAIAATGVTPLITTDADLRAAVHSATHLLVSAGPSADGDAFLPLLADAIRGANLQWIGYLSTTGVYGDHGGAWVDEDTPCTPSNPRGKWRLAAETEWLALGAHVFRLAGIYGPGRGPFSKVRNGTARRIIKPGQMFGRIHVDDIAQAVTASIAHPNPGRIYNVADNDPAPPQDVLGYAAELLGVPLPPAEDFETAEMTPMARSFYLENRRVRNDRLRDELGVTLKYPDYKSGLRALLAAEATGE
jgi:nucleoside-diphosphate-sugar epimerase